MRKTIKLRRPETFVDPAALFLKLFTAEERAAAGITGEVIEALSLDMGETMLDDLFVIRRGNDIMNAAVRVESSNEDYTMPEFIQTSLYNARYIIANGID